MKRYTVFYYTPAILWAAFVFVMCSMPPKDVDKISLINFPEMDKVAHFTFYFVLTFMLLWGDKKSMKHSKKRTLSWVVGAILYGITIEILQGLYFTGRSASVFDASFNTLGVLLSLTVFTFLFNRKKQNAL
jgi:VanZ family protein